MPTLIVPSPLKKYRNRYAVYDGVRYDSQREAYYAAELDLKLRARLIKGWQRQVAIKLKVNDVLICKLVVDFRIEHLDGSREWVEVKGHPTRDFKLKWKLFDALYPQARKTVVK